MKIDAENVKVSGELEVGKSVKAGGEVTANADTLPVNLSGTVSVECDGGETAEAGF